MFYGVNISATVDHIDWTCPRCGTHNQSGSDLNTCCEKCDYNIENDIYIPSDLNDFLTGEYYNEEESEEE